MTTADNSIVNAAVPSIADGLHTSGGQLELVVSGYVLGGAEPRAPRRKRPPSGTVKNAIVGIDLADRKQMVVVTDHDSKVFARKTFRCRAWDLGVALDWAADRARAKGWVGVTVAWEPTGHRWRVLGQLAAERAMPLVCVQPSVSSWSRRGEDLTPDKTDEKDAVLIARLTAMAFSYAAAISTVAGRS
jgi:hypothetical protein